MIAVCALEAPELAMDENALLELHAPAFRLAARILGSAEAAQDAVQGAYLAALQDLRGGTHPDDLRAWFLKVTANAALRQLRGEARRRRREASAMTTEAGRGVRVGSGGAPGAPFESARDRELVERLREAVAGLEEKYRLPVALCCEEGLTRQQAAAVLDMPESTVKKYVALGLERLRTSLGSAGYAAAPATVLAALAHTAPPVPAALPAAVQGILAGRITDLGTVAAGAAAKGGMVMKIVAGVMAAGLLAGGAAVLGSGSGLHGSAAGAAPGTVLAAPPADEKPAPLNDFKGFQEREEVFEFTQKPTVTRGEGQGAGGEARYVISFASKGKCDATVTVVGPDGKIVRHLASGVLGANAPYPLQPNSLSQKLEWDGQDDAGAKAPAGCKVRVSLGLQPKFEMNIGYDPFDLPSGNDNCQMKEYGKNTDYLVGKGPGGELYILGTPNGGGMAGRVFKDGKYVKTFWPPSAKDVEKLAGFVSPTNPKDKYRFDTTTWGDKVLLCDRYGPALYNGDGRKVPLPDHGKAMFFVAGINDYKLEPWPASVPKAAADPKIQAYYGEHCPRLAADRYREEIYAGFGEFIRFDGKTGKLDSAWTPHGELKNATEVHVGPDGLLYLRVGGANYGQFVIRMDHDGKTVPFTGNGAAPMPHEKWEFSGKGMYCGDGWSPALKGQNVIALWNGMISTSNVHTRGMYVSPRGFIVCTVNSMDKAWGLKHGVPANWPTKPSYAGADWQVFEQTLVVVFDKDGNVLTANAVGDTGNGHGVAMDRDGNIYSAIGGRWPAGQTSYDGIVGEKGSASLWGSYGSLMKFRGGTPFPRGEASYGKETPAGFAKLVGYRSGPTGYKGTLWIWGGLVCQTPDICTCHNIRYDMDYYARHWIPSNQLYSVSVLDANGNRIARLGRYGNVDDTDEDVKAGKDGLRFVWPRAVAVSDTALYVADQASKRILKAAIAYAAEEAVPVP